MSATEETTVTARYIDVSHSSSANSRSASTTISSPSPPPTSSSPSVQAQGTVVPDPGSGSTALNVVNSPPTNGTSTSNNVYLIGLEFVRQYYTVLHQGPLYLHRFYAEHSAFVHDDSKAVYGQADIRDRIQHLNFRNCVAKILQVDSQETLGNGVVIQVRGELSNNGKPLRRFMQTFVLAPQTPKRYYVRNDIFHYEDDDAKEELNTSSTGLADSSLSNEHEHADVEIEKSEEEDQEDEQEEEAEDEEIPSVSACSPTSLPEIQTAGGDHHGHELNNGQILEVSVLETTKHQEKESEGRRPSHGFITTTKSSTPTPSSGDEESGTGVKKGQSQSKEIVEAPPTTTVAPVPVAPAPKTFANLFKQQTPSSTPTPAAQPFSSATSANNPISSTSTTASSTSSPFPPTTTNSNITSTHRPQNNAENAGDSSPGAVSPQPPQHHPSEPYKNQGQGLPPRGGGGHGHYAGGHRGGGGYHRDRRDRERLTSRSSTANDGETGSVDGDGGSNKPIPRYPDSHQLFVGNLPHTATQTEIKEIFSVYGRVAEVKILKPGMKNSGPKVPYFCFVIYEKSAFAQAALNDKAKINMRMGDGSHRRLNVEEKRPRENYPYFHRGGVGGSDRDRTTSAGDRERENANSSTGGGQGQTPHFRSGAGGTGTNASMSSSSNTPVPPGSGSGNQNQQQQQGRGGGGGQRGGGHGHTRTFRPHHQQQQQHQTRGGGGGGSGAR